MELTRSDLASRCYDIHSSLGTKDVPEFEFLPTVGMMVSLALHIRGLPNIKYEKLKLIASHFFNIPSMVLKSILLRLADIEFVKLQTQGATIDTIIPSVPYFDTIYEGVGEYAKTINSFNEAEELAVQMLIKLSSAPTEKSGIYTIGAEKKLIDRGMTIGKEGGYILSKRARGKEILLSPIFFSENSDVVADLVAKAGAKKIGRIFEVLKKAQGWPLELIEKDKKINNDPVTDDEIKLLRQLACDGMVKPPAIKTEHAGTNHFLFTPAPGTSKLNPSNREIYERAMALVSATRQGQLLPKQFRIRNPLWILNSLKTKGYLRPSTEAYDQYQTLVFMKVGRLSRVSGGRYRFELNDEAEENIKALDLAISILERGEVSKMELNEDAVIALQKDQNYIESLIASEKLRQKEPISLNEEYKEEIESFLIKGMTL